MPDVSNQYFKELTEITGKCLIFSGMPTELRKRTDCAKIELEFAKCNNIIKVRTKNQRDFRVFFDISNACYPKDNKVYVVDK